MDDTPIVQSCCLLAVFGKLEEIRHRNRYPSLKGVASHTTKKVPQSERTVRGTVLDGLTVRRVWPGLARQWDPSPEAEDETC